MSGTARRRLALVVSSAGAMLVALDGTVLIMAQPSLRRDLSASVTQTQWVSTGYLLAVAALLVIAGRLGDRHGHRRLLLCGLCGFAGASAGIALAPGIGVMIALRAAQGVFGALLQPATLALLRLAYPADRLGKAVAIRTSAIGVAGAAGPVLGGVLVAHLGWRSVFAINVPVALAIAAIAAAMPAPAPARQESQRFDVAGAVLIAGVLAVCVYTLAGIPAHGWTSGPTLAGLACTTGGAAVLITHERRAAHPIVPTVVARSAPVTAAMTILLLTSGGVFGALFAATFLLQDMLKLDPLAASLRGLPMSVLMVVGAPVASVTLRRHGPRRTAIAGSVLVILGILGMTSLTSADTWATTTATFALLGLGFATVMVTATGTVVGDAPAGHAGTVGGLKQTAVNIGPALGIAVAASTMTTSPPTGATEPALLALSAVAALALFPALKLPARRHPSHGIPNRTAATPPGTNSEPQPADDASSR